MPKIKEMTAISIMTCSVYTLICISFYKILERYEQCFHLVEIRCQFFVCKLLIQLGDHSHIRLFLFHDCHEFSFSTGIKCSTQETHFLSSC